MHPFIVDDRSHIACFSSFCILRSLPHALLTGHLRVAFLFGCSRWGLPLKICMACEAYGGAPHCEQHVPGWLPLSLSFGRRRLFRKQMWEHAAQPPPRPWRGTEDGRAASEALAVQAQSRPIQGRRDDGHRCRDRGAEALLGLAGWPACLRLRPPPVHLKVHVCIVLPSFLSCACCAVLSARYAVCLCALCIRCGWSASWPAHQITRHYPFDKVKRNKWNGVVRG